VSGRLLEPASSSADSFGSVRASQVRLVLPQRPAELFTQAAGFLPSVCAFAEAQLVRRLPPSMGMEDVL